MSLFERTLQDELNRLQEREHHEMKILALMDAESNGNPLYFFYDQNISVSVGLAHEEALAVLRRLRGIGEVEQRTSVQWSITPAGSRRYEDFIRRSPAAASIQVIDLLHGLRKAARELSPDTRAEILVRTDDAERALTIPTARQQAAGALDAVIKVAGVAKGIPDIADLLVKLQHSIGLLFR